MSSTEPASPQKRPRSPSRRRLRRRVARGGGSRVELSDDEGSAVIEFLALGLLLLLPAVWFLLAVAEVQASSYAAVGAADQAAKMHTTGDADPGERAARSEAAVTAALADFGIGTERAQISRQCSPDCEAAGALVGYTVEIRVPVPLIPDFAGLEHRLVTVSASSTQVRGE